MISFDRTGPVTNSPKVELETGYPNAMPEASKHQTTLHSLFVISLHRRWRGQKTFMQICYLFQLWGTGLLRCQVTFPLMPVRHFWHRFALEVGHFAQRLWQFHGTSHASEISKKLHRAYTKTRKCDQHVDASYVMRIQFSAVCNPFAANLHRDGTHQRHHKCPSHDKVDWWTDALRTHNTTDELGWTFSFCVSPHLARSRDATCWLEQAWMSQATTTWLPMLTSSALRLNCVDCVDCVDGWRCVV